METFLIFSNIMSETYILDIKNMEYFTYSIKNSVPNVISIVYEIGIKTVEIIGTFTEEDRTNLSSFIENYQNPEKITPKKTKILTTTKLSCREVGDWCTQFNWTTDVSIQNIILSVKLEARSEDSDYIETFRYGLRVVDVTNNIVITETEYYNDEYEDKTIAIPEINLSLGNVELELQVKKYNKGSAVYIMKAYTEYS